MKKINQIKAPGFKFHFYAVPVHALYGSIGGIDWICEKHVAFPHVQKFDAAKNHLVNTQEIIPYYDIRVWDVTLGFWVDASDKDFPAIRREIRNFRKSGLYVREKCTYGLSREMRDKRIVGQPEGIRSKNSYDYKPGSQARVDGKGYDISYEENIIAPKRPFTGGFPVQYRKDYPVATFKEFDGLLDDVHRDHLKIDQTKIRPEKSGCASIKNYNGPKSAPYKRAEEQHIYTIYPVRVYPSTK